MYVTRKRFAQTDAEALQSKPYKYPVTVVENSRIIEISGNEVVIEDRDFNTYSIEAENVVTCHLRPRSNAMFEELKRGGTPVITVGDAAAPRNLAAAVREGARFGLSLEDHILLNPNGAVTGELPLDVAGSLLS